MEFNNLRSTLTDIRDIFPKPTVTYLGLGHAIDDLDGDIPILITGPLGPNFIMKFSDGETSLKSLFTALSVELYSTSTAGVILLPGGCYLTSSWVTTHRKVTTPVKGDKNPE